MNLFLDAAERVFWTFAATFVATMLASPVFDNLGVGWQDALKLSVFTAAATSLKVLLAVLSDQASGGQLLPKPTVEVKPDA